jgi:hypothetical protein
MSQRAPAFPITPNQVVNDASTETAAPMRARQISGTQLRVARDNDSEAAEDEQRAEPSQASHVTLLPPPGPVGDGAAHLSELAAATVPPSLTLRTPDFDSFEQEFWNHQPTPAPLSAAPDIALSTSPVAPPRQPRPFAKLLFAVAALALAALVGVELCSMLKLF